MTSLLELWLPILLSSVFVFAASSIVHMVLPIHRKDFAPAPDEDAVRAALKGAPPGQYMFPWAGTPEEMQSPEIVEKLEAGPVGVVLIRPNGSWGMGPALLKWFVYTLVVGVFCAYLAGLANAPGAEAMDVLQVTGAVAFLGYVFAQYHEWTWKGLQGGVMAKFMLDGLAYALITAATFAWLWPAAA